MRSHGLRLATAVWAVAGMLAPRVVVGQDAARHDSVAAGRDSGASTPGPRGGASPDSAVRRTARHDVRVCAGGDVTLGTNLDTAWLRRTVGIDSGADLGTRSAAAAPLLAPETLVAPLRPLVRDADVALLNLEGAIGEEPVDVPKCTAERKYCFALRSPPAAARALRTVVDSPAVIIANLANNHAHDAGDAGLAITRTWLDSAGVLAAGADTEPAIAVTGGGDTIAVLGFSAWSDPGVQDTAAVRRLVLRAVTRYGRVIVTAHLGAEGRLAQRTPDSVERYVGEDRGNAVAFAHTAADAGAALVVGHGPHVLRAAEWRHGALIFYSLGNLINYGPFGLGEPMDRGAVVCATLDTAGRARAVVLQPTWQRAPGALAADPTRRARTLVDSLGRLDFPGTGAAVDAVTGAVTERPPLPASPHRAVSRRQRGRPLETRPARPRMSRPPSTPVAPPATASPPAPTDG